MKKVFFAFLAISFITACSDQDNPIGKWDDNIHLSQKHADFGAEGDSITITTKGDGWWIDGITFEDSTYLYYGREDVNLESNSYKITEEDFGIVRSNKSLFIKLKENNTHKVRTMTITLQAGNYFDYVSISQDKD